MVNGEWDALLRVVTNQQQLITGCYTLYLTPYTLYLTKIIGSCDGCFNL